MTARLHKSATRLAVVVAGAATATALSALPAFAATVTGNPTTGLSLTAPTSVALTGSGFSNSVPLYLLECSSEPASMTACDIGGFKSTPTNGAGAFTYTFSVKSGTIGNGKCDATSTGCVIAVSDNAANPTTVYVPLSFGAAAASPTPAATATAPASAAASASATATASASASAKASASPTKKATVKATKKPVAKVAATQAAAPPPAPVSGGSAVAPTSVAAGSGGTADDNGSNVELIALLGVGGLALTGLTIGLARRRS